MLGFDFKTAMKWNFPIVSDITVFDLTNGQSMF
jgi:hypothetical protein